MAITVNGTPASKGGTSGQTSDTLSFTSNGTTLVVLVTFSGTGAISGAGCVWNGTETMVEMWNKRETALGRYATYGYVLQGATTGTHNIVATYGLTTTDANIIAISFDNVAAGNTAGTTWRTATTNSGAGVVEASASVTVANAVSTDFVIDCFNLNQPSATMTTSGGTNRKNELNIQGDGWSQLCSSAEPAGSVAMSYSFNSQETEWAIGAAPLILSGGGGGTVVPQIYHHLQEQGIA